MKLLIALLAASALFAQEKAPRKQFVDPEWRMIDPVVARDEGCGRDLAKAGRMDGIEKRKYLADLFIYGCVERLTGGFLAKLLAFRNYGEGDNAVQIRKVLLIPTAIGDKPREGWVLESATFTAEDVRKVLEAIELLKTTGKK